MSADFAIYEISYAYRTYLNGGQRLPINLTETITIEGRTAADKVVAHLATLGIDADLRPFHPTLTARQAINLIATRLVEFPIIREDAA